MTKSRTTSTRMSLLLLLRQSPLVLLICLLLLLAPSINGHTLHQLSRHRHLVLEDLSMVVVMADAEQTQGPFAEQDDDYVWTTNDLTAAGRAGQPGIGYQDRATVVDGIPLELTINVYDISNPVGVQMEDIQVFLWHADAAGQYSAAEPEGTEGQVWCRGVQTTGSNGQVTFRTILAGWYAGRAIHYHLRLRFQGATPFAATTQFYVSDSDLAQFQTVEPYASNPQSITPLFRDGIFARLGDATLQHLLTLKLQGSVETGFTSSILVGIEPGAYSRYQGDGAGSQNTRPDGEGPVGEGVELPVATDDETDVPTAMPIAMTDAPTTSPTTSSPTVSPTTTEPTAMPTVTTDAPTTLEPTMNPTKGAKETSPTATEVGESPVSAPIESSPVAAAPIVLEDEEEFEFEDDGDYPLSTPHATTPTALPIADEEQQQLRPTPSSLGPNIFNGTIIDSNSTDLVSLVPEDNVKEDEEETEESNGSDASESNNNEITTEEDDTESAVSRTEAETNSVKSAAKTLLQQYTVGALFGLVVALVAVARLL